MTAKNKTIVVGNDILNIHNYTDHDPSLPDLADEDWRSRANEMADNNIDSCYRYDVGDGLSLYIDCEQGSPMCATISDQTMLDHMSDWFDNVSDGSQHLADWLAEWGLDGLGVLTPASRDDDGPCWVWRQPNYYQGTCNAPLPCLDRDDDGDIQVFASYAAAQAHVDAYYTEPSAYDGVPQCNVLSHGQAGSDTLTIVRAD